MALELNSLIRSIDVLERSLNAAHQDIASLSEELQETVRAGVIQNFEVAYEQCWKFVQRWIKENYSPTGATHLRTRKELFRLAARYGLIADPAPWFKYGDARNQTSHIYNEEQALFVFEITDDFLRDAKHLLKQLQAAND